MRTIATLFTGFDGVGIGAKAAGLELAWGIEIDPAIAAVANDNLGGHVMVADILACDPWTFEPVDVLHASPPCTRASQANNSAEENEDGLKESPLDMALAAKTIEFVEALEPPVFTLENVWGYRVFQSFAGGRKCEGIVPALIRLGYVVKYWHLNSADYGVPQTRKRLILVAARDFIPQRPSATHRDSSKTNGAQMNMFGALPPWIGWYEAIQDLIQALPETRFAEWQLARLPAEITSFIMQVQGQGGDGVRYIGEPMQAITSAHGEKKYRAFLLEGQNARADDKGGISIYAAGDPSMPITASAKGRARAFLIGGQYGQPQGTENRGAQQSGETDPSFTVTSINKGDWRAWLPAGKVVAMTPRCLARFQSFPDWYWLPDSNRLACKGIGNAVPPLWYQRIVESVLEAL